MGDALANLFELFLAEEPVLPAVVKRVVSYREPFAEDLEVLRVHLATVYQ